MADFDDITTVAGGDEPERHRGDGKRKSIGGEESGRRRSSGGEQQGTRRKSGAEDVPQLAGRHSGEDELEEGELEEEDGPDGFSSSGLAEGGEEDRGEEGTTRSRPSRMSRAFSSNFDADEFPIARRKSAIWPEVEEKFRPGDVQRLMEKVVKEHLDGPGPPEDMNSTIKSIVEAIQARVKALKYPRYRIITACVLGERKGEGVNSVTRCLWDPLADCLATYSYINDTVFCTAVVYGVYFY